MSGPEAAAPVGRGRFGRDAFPAGLLTGLLPAGVAVVDGLDGSFEGSRLVERGSSVRDAAFAVEFDDLGAATAHRRQEFARARICAHAAVARLGHLPEPIPIGPRREPRWPAGLVGSITHCAGYRAAAVARAADVVAIGLDAEPDQPLPAGITRLAFTDADRAGSGPMARFRNWDRVAFSARESVFKAWFAVTGRWLDFADVTLFLAPDGPWSGDFTATVGADVPGAGELVRACGTAGLTGRFQWAPVWAPDLVLTAVTLRHRPARDQPAPPPAITQGRPPR